MIRQDAKKTYSVVIHRVNVKDCGIFRVTVGPVMYEIRGLFPGISGLRKQIADY